MLRKIQRLKLKVFLNNSTTFNLIEVRTSARRGGSFKCYVFRVLLNAIVTLCYVVLVVCLSTT